MLHSRVLYWAYGNPSGSALGLRLYFTPYPSYIPPLVIIQIQYKGPDIVLLPFVSTSYCTTSSNLMPVLNRDREGSQSQSSLGPQLDFAGSAICQYSHSVFSLGHFTVESEAKVLFLV